MEEKITELEEKLEASKVALQEETVSSYIELFICGKFEKLFQLIYKHMSSK